VFEEGRTPGLLGIAELELGAVLGREVELRTYEDLSRYFGTMSGRVCSMPPDDEVRGRHRACTRAGLTPRRTSEFTGMCIERCSSQSEAEWDADARGSRLTSGVNGRT